MLNYLSSELRGLKKLKILDLNLLNSFGENNVFHDPNASVLKFKPPKFLVSFRINFEGDPFNEKLLSEFTSNVQQCHKLQHLNLRFIDKLDNIKLSEALIWACFFKNLQNLKTLTFKRDFFSSEEFEGNQAFLEGFQHLKNLEVLKLSLVSCMSESPPIIFTCLL